MIDWLSTLSWLQLCWLIYGIVVALLAIPVSYIEHHAKKVDGASGWVMFGWIMLGFYGFLILLVISAVHWFLHRSTV